MERIGSTTLNRLVLNNNQRTLQRLGQLELQLASGKRIAKPSDDPVGVRQSLRLRSVSRALDDYQANIDKSLGFKNMADATLGQATSLLQQMKAAAIQGGNDTLDASARRALGASVDAALRQMLDLANTQFDGRYIFSGEATRTKPFELDETTGMVTYRGSLQDFEVQVNPISTSPVSENGYDIFQQPQDVFATLVQLRDALNDDDEQLVRDLIGDLDTAHEQVSQAYGSLGGVGQRLELMENQLADLKITIDESVSQIEDVDLAKVITEFNATEVALKAGLDAGARVLQPSLLDYLQ